MIEELERLATSPQALMDALRSMGVSEDLIQLALVGSGASTAEARLLMGAAPANRLKGSKKLPTQKDIGAIVPPRDKPEASILALSRAQADVDQAMISMVEQNKTASIALISISKSLEETALNQTEQGALLTEAILRIEEALKGLPGAVKELKEFLKDPIDKLTKVIKGTFQ